MICSFYLRKDEKYKFVMIFVSYIAHMISMIPLYDTHDTSRLIRYHAYDLSGRIKKKNRASIWVHC
jgi:hypothetical protein